MAFMTKFELLTTYAYIWIVLEQQGVPREAHALQLQSVGVASGSSPVVPPQPQVCALKHYPFATNVNKTLCAGSVQGDPTDLLWHYSQNFTTEEFQKMLEETPTLLDGTVKDIMKRKEKKGLFLYLNRKPAVKQSLEDDRCRWEDSITKLNKQKEEARIKLAEARTKEEQDIRKQLEELQKSIKEVQSADFNQVMKDTATHLTKLQKDNTWKTFLENNNIQNAQISQVVEQLNSLAESENFLRTLKNFVAAAVPICLKQPVLDRIVAIQIILTSELNNTAKPSLEKAFDALNVDKTTNWKAMFAEAGDTESLGKAAQALEEAVGHSVQEEPSISFLELRSDVGVIAEVGDIFKLNKPGTVAANEAIEGLKAKQRNPKHVELIVHAQFKALQETFDRDKKEIDNNKTLSPDKTKDDVLALQARFIARLRQLQDLETLRASPKSIGAKDLAGEQGKIAKVIAGMLKPEHERAKEAEERRNRWMNLSLLVCVVAGAVTVGVPTCGAGVGLGGGTAALFWSCTVRHLIARIPARCF